jgi:hypothetical protein
MNILRNSYVRSIEADCDLMSVGRKTALKGVHDGPEFLANTTCVCY